MPDVPVERKKDLEAQIRSLRSKIEKLRRERKPLWQVEHRLMMAEARLHAALLGRSGRKPRPPVVRAPTKVGPLRPRFDPRDLVPEFRGRPR